MKRGEVWWADLPPPDRRRPVVLLSRDSAYDVRSLVTIAPVTTRIRGIRAEVLLGPEDGLSRQCVVNLDNINTIAKDKLQRVITELGQDKIGAVDEAIHFALGLAEKEGTTCMR